MSACRPTDFLSCSRPQEFLCDKELGQSKLSAVVVSGELVSTIAAKDKVEAVRTKMNTAREDWKNIMTGLHSREICLQVRTTYSRPVSPRRESLWRSKRRTRVFQDLLSQMKDFEACAEPLQECLNANELSVQESSTRLHDLTAKKSELHKLQVQTTVSPRVVLRPSVGLKTVQRTWSFHVVSKHQLTSVALHLSPPCAVFLLFLSFCLLHFFFFCCSPPFVKILVLSQQEMLQSSILLVVTAASINVPECY